MNSAPDRPLDHAAPSPERALVQVKDYAVFMLDAEGHVASWNEGVRAILGWEEADWLGQSLAILFSPEDRAAGVPARELGQAVAAGRADDDTWMVRKDGSRFFASGVLTRVTDSRDQLVGFVKVLRDCTADRAAREERERLLAAEHTARTEAERRTAELVAAIEGIPDAIFFGNNGGITRCNGRALALLEVSSVEELRQNWPERADKFKVRLSRHGPPLLSEGLPLAGALQGENAAIEVWVTPPGTGEDTYLRAVAAPTRVDGEVTGAVVVVSNLTERYRLDEERRKMALLVEHSSDLICISTFDGEPMYLNTAGRQWLGLQSRPITDTDPQVYFTPEDTARFEAEALPALRASGRWSGEIHLRHVGTGRVNSLIWRSFAIRNEATGEPVAWASIAANLSEFKRLESALIEREQQFRALLAGVRDYAIFELGVDGRIASWHEGAALMKGYTPDEAIGMPFSNLFDADDRERGQPELEMRVAAETGEYKGEGKRRRKDGSLFDAAVVLSATRGKDGELLGYLELAQDVTMRNRREQAMWALHESTELARVQAEQTSRSKAEFLAVISHELRTPLSAILGWAHLLERGIPEPERVRQGLSAILRNARAQVQLIEDLLDMSRIESGTLRLEMQPMDLVSVVHAAMEAASPAAGVKKIDIRTRLEVASLPIRGDPARLQQVVWNLLSNSVRFTGIGGRITVTVARRGDDVGLVVEDNGTGIQPEFLPQVFDRFRQQDAGTTRQHGGLGIGLSIVRELVALHGGKVLVNSPGPGRGSTFTVLLPQRGVPAGLEESAAPTVAAINEALRGRRVILVEDEPDARAVAQQVLQSAGAQVLAAADARTGLELLRRHHGDVLVSDIAMPGDDGYALIRWVRGLPPEEGGQTPAVALTAYARTEDARRALDAGYQVHLAKPVEPARLVDVVAELVGKATAD